MFTPEFKAKFDAEIEKDVEDELTKKGISSDRKTFVAEFIRIQARSSFYNMWNHPDAFDKYPNVKEYYESIGLLTPQFIESVFESAEKGLQSQPRIMWKGEIKKIDDIEEIYSFARVGNECVH